MSLPIVLFPSNSMFAASFYTLRGLQPNQVCSFMELSSIAVNACTVYGLFWLSMFFTFSNIHLKHKMWGVESGGVLRLLKGNRAGLTTLLVPHAGTQEGALSRGPVVTPFLRWAHFCF